MNPILIFVALVAVLAPGAVAQSLPYDGQEYHQGTIVLPTPSTPRDARPAAFAGQSIEVHVPKFNPIGPNGERRWLTSAWLSLQVSVSQRSSVTNTSATDWGWGEWSQGVSFFGALGAGHALGDDPNSSPTPHFGGGGTILGTCAWDRLAVGQTKVFQSDPVLSVLLTDWIGPTERSWQGVGDQAVTITLGASEQASGFWPGHGQADVSMDIRLARPGFAGEVAVFYRYTNEPPHAQLGMMPFNIEAPPRFKVVEGAWADSPTWELGQPSTTPWWVSGRDVNPSRVVGAFFETFANATVSFGIEHLGQGSATCAGDAVAVTLFEVGGETLPWEMSLARPIGGGGSPTSLLSYDGTTDWSGASGLLRLPNVVSSDWGMLRPIANTASVVAPLVQVATVVDTAQTGMFPQSNFVLAWDGTMDQRTRGRIITIERW